MSISEKESLGIDSAGPAWFVTTHWSVVLDAKGSDPALAGAALEKLCQTYWRPLYTFIRRNGYSPADAQDLTQEFFAKLLSKDHLRHLRDQRGKFRSFLLTFVKHFLCDERDKARAQKRGGGLTAVSIDDAEGEESFLLRARELSPDELFERRWAEAALEEALRRLRDEYVESGKGALFDRLKDAQPGKHGETSYAEIGAELGMTESGIKSAALRLRRRHSEILRDEIAQTVTRAEEVDEEIRHLISLLSA